MSIICDEYGQIDYEAMILARQEAQELAGDCDQDCEHCILNDYCIYDEKLYVPIGEIGEIGEEDEDVEDI